MLLLEERARARETAPLRSPVKYTALQITVQRRYSSAAPPFTVAAQCIASRSAQTSSDSFETVGAVSSKPEPEAPEAAARRFHTHGTRDARLSSRTDGQARDGEPPARPSPVVSRTLTRTVYRNKRNRTLVSRSDVSCLSPTYTYRDQDVLRNVCVYLVSEPCAAQLYTTTLNTTTHTRGLILKSEFNKNDHTRTLAEQ